MLNFLDDYPIHQTPEPVAHPATTDRNVYDRFFFEGFSDDGEWFFGIAIYESFPKDLQQRVEGLYVTYRFDPDMNRQRYARQPGMVHEKISECTATSYERMKERLGTVAHPLVFTQAETGRKVCNFSPWFAIGIEGMTQREADEILEQVAAFYVEPGNAYFHNWSGDDMVLWDNWRMLHCASGVAPGEMRHMQRTTILGDYALGRPAINTCGPAG